MAGFSISCRLWPLFVLLTTSQCVHFLVEKGSKTAIGCNYKKYELNTTWQVRAGHDVISVTSCTFGENLCVDHMPHQFVGEAENISDGFASYLIINNVRINETEFRCLRKYSVGTNTLEVYARPSNPVCYPVELDYTKKNLQVKCNVTKVFPSVSAVLYIRGVTFSKERTLSQHCSREESGSLMMDGYSALCVWRISAANLEPVTYRYYIKVFPNLSNSTGIRVPYALSQDYTIQLRIPVAVIDYSHCPGGPGVVDGKIITGSTATCRCVLESPGFPSGQARWYTHNGNHSIGRDDATDGSSTLIIDTNISGQSYKCRAESSLNTRLNRGPVYIPVFTSAKTSSGPETYSLRIEQVAGIVAGSVLLTIIIAAVLWKWRSRKRQSADTTRVVYNRPSDDAASDSGCLQVYENFEKEY